MPLIYDATDAHKKPPKPKPPKSNYDGDAYNNSGYSDGNAAAPGVYYPPEKPNSNTGASTGGNQSYNKPPEYDYNPYQDLRDDIKRQRRREEEARRKAIDAGVGQLQSQIPLLERQRDDAARQAYIRSQQSQVNMPQQLAAMGATGGLSETAMMQSNAGYQNTQNELTNAYNDAVAGINGDIANLKSSGELSIVDNSGKYYQQLLDLTQEQQREALERQKKASSYTSGDVQTSNGLTNGIQPPDSNGTETNIGDDTAAAYLRAANSSRNPYYQQSYTTAEKEDAIKKIVSTAISEDEALRAFLNLGITQSDINAYYNRYGINRYHSGR